MFDASKYYNQDRYYDGIPPELAEHDSKLSLKELEAEIDAEKIRCEKKKSWDDLEKID